MKNADAKFWRDDKKYYGIFSNNAFSQFSLAHAFLEMKLYGHNMDISPVRSWI